MRIKRDIKRTHKRIKVSSIGEILGEGKSGGLRVRLGDIGIGGIEIFSGTQRVVGEHLEIKVTFLTKKGKNLVGTFSGTLRWMIPYKEGYLGGIEFDKKIDGDNHPKFFEYIMEGRSFSL